MSPSLAVRQKCLNARRCKGPRCEGRARQGNPCHRGLPVQVDSFVFSQCLELLINANAALDLNCNQGWTAIHYAVVNNHEACVEKLIYARCDPAEDNLKKKTPLHLAKELGLTNMEKILSDPDAVVARCAKRYKDIKK